MSKTTDNLLNLPRRLSDGLILRWGEPSDREPLAEFSALMHSDTAEPDIYIKNWTLDLMSGNHPTVKPSDFLIVVDENANNKIVSTVMHISQTWAYAGIPFKFGRPEAVATLPEYRRKGLIRTQFEVIHALSAARQEMAQGITGIPWYYRQFGYEMTVSLGGARRLYWQNITKLGTDETEKYQARPATSKDIALLSQLYAIQCSGNLLTRMRPENEWQHELTLPYEKMMGFSYFQIVEDLAGNPVGYFDYYPFAPNKLIIVKELAVLPGHSLRAVAEFLTRTLKTLADEASKDLPEPYSAVSFNFGEAHPLYQALGSQLEKQITPYAWYMRVPDLAGFIRHIAPALEKRLIGSIIEGHSGILKLNFYRDQLAITFENGKITEVGTFIPEKMDGGDAVFPELTFLHLLFGHRTIEELNYIYADCRVSNVRSRVLLDVLFPKQPSNVIALQ